jgi:hydroxymethylpyrimidine/phosphomethylpyrimidine kinase
MISQLLSVLEDTDILAMKTGMLSDAPTVRIVADTLKSFYAASKTPAFVLDPVCVSTSGHTLLHEDAIEVLDSQLAPLATLITPNSAEAEAILHHRDEDLKIENVGDMIRAARRLVTRGCSAVLLKGGHVLATSDDVKDVLRDQPTIQVFREGGIRADNMEILSSVASQPVGQRAVVDVLAIQDGDTVLFVRPQVDSSSTHGTGCTLSAAITSYLAHGHEREARLNPHCRPEC